MLQDHSGTLAPSSEGSPISHVLFSLLATIGCTEPTSHASVHSPTPTGEPFVVSVAPRPLLPLDRQELQALEARFQPRLMDSETEDLPYSQSVSIHLLRIAGRTGCFADELLTDGEALVRTFLDSSLGEATYGEPAVLQTRNGLRFRSLSPVKWLNGRAVEAHDHQTLAALAELGYPLSTSVRVAAGEFTLADVLADAIANSYLDKQELEWTVIALTAYLAPRQREWTNKFGQVFTFDDLAKALLARELSAGSCGGTHLLNARVFLLRADETYGLLTEEAGTLLRESIRSAVERIVANQRADGAWDLAWNAPDAEEWAHSGDSKSRLLVTGHLGELLLKLPDEYRVADSVLTRAGTWLLPELRQRIDSQLKEQFCPLTHAFCYLRWIAIPDDAPTGVGS